MFSWHSLPRPIVALAPMADMTDSPFCLVCKRLGTPIIFREMVSAEAVVRLNPKTLKMAEFDERERPIVQQIFGSEPATMAEAARIILEKFKPDALDINMGCPVYKITSNFDGAALIKQPERAAAIVKALKDATHVPVSVKTRLGWKRKDECVTFVRTMEQAGADLITVHGRTKEQGYAGTADWQAVGAARKAVPNLPFLVNGDVTDSETARRALDESGADGVLIGRGALGNPWVLGEIFEGLQNTTYGSDRTNRTYSEIAATLREHARLHVQCYGERGLIKLRKHLPWYFKNFPNAKEIRSSLVKVTTPEELNNVLKTIENMK